MGGCCSADNNDGHNMTDVNTFASAKLDAKSLAAIVKAQACFRGLKARRLIKNKYGFQGRTLSSIKSRGINLTTMDPEKRELQKQEVQEIRSKLAQFVYDEEPDDESPV